LGLWLLFLGWESFYRAGWLWIKLAAVVGLLGYHLYCARLIKAFAADENPHSETFYRWFNELPALVLFLVVIMVVVKPF
ncbi:MAG: CopD family protein, partial [Gammaproteobacteria bacterium]|nr:CopD family protein [Gammaproteobacteria bacterium]